MSNLVRECTICPVKIVLEGFDQYNDYSVRTDYRLSIDDPDTGYFRQWHVGSHIGRAIECYDLAVSFVHRRQYLAF